MLKVLTFIGARAGSKGVVGKNIRLFSGRPLIEWTIQAAQSSKLSDFIFLSTDSPEILAAARNAGGCFTEYLRPPELATDDASLVDVVNHALGFLAQRGLTFDLVVLLQPTSPLRTSKDINEAFDLYLSTSSPKKSLISVSEMPSKTKWLFKLDNRFLSRVFKVGVESQRQTIQDRFFLPNGAIYITPIINGLIESFDQGDLIPFVMPEERSIDIDTEKDFQSAETAFNSDPDFYNSH